MIEWMNECQKTGKKRMKENEREKDGRRKDLELKEKIREEDDEET